MTFLNPVLVDVVDHGHRYFGETMGFWIQTGALFLSAVAAVLLIYESAQAERRRAVIDLVISQNDDERMQGAKDHLRRLREQGFSNFAKVLEDKNSENYTHTMFMVNNHEFVACGIRGKALNEAIYKRMYCSMVIRDWELFQPLIVQIRLNNGNKKTIFQDFQWLAERWKKKPLK